MILPCKNQYWIKLHKTEKVNPDRWSSGQHSIPELPKYKAQVLPLDHTGQCETFQLLI
jgi:hypothetical protein